MTYLRETYYNANSRYLSSEAMEEIKKSKGRKNALNQMKKKYRVGSKRIYDIWDDCAKAQQTDDPSSLMSQPLYGGKVTQLQEHQSKSKKKKSNSTVETQSKAYKPILKNQSDVNEKGLEMLRQVAKPHIFSNVN